MSQPLTADLVKATTGQYSIPIRDIFSQAWQKIKGLKKSFWGGFALTLLILIGVYIVFQFIIALCSVLQLNNLQAITQFIGGGFFEVMRLLLSISLVFLALQHLRHQATHATMVFEFSKAWKPLTIIALSFYVLNFLFLLGSRFLLDKFNAPGLESTYALGMAIQFIIFLFFIYLFSLTNNHEHAINFRQKNVAQTKFQCCL